MEPEISIVIPAFNEAARLPTTLDRVHEYLTANDIRAEVLVVDDGSSDGTAALVRERVASWPALRLVSGGRNQGKGAAVRLGMIAASGRYRVFTDADLSVPIEDLEKLLRPLRNAGGVAIASRALPGSEVQLHQPIYREAMGKLFNRLVRVFVLGGIRDTQCGLKAFTGKAATDIFPQLQTAGFGFDVEVLYRARRAGHRITEVPTRWINSPLSKVRPLPGLKAFLDIIAIPGRVRRHPGPVADSSQAQRRRAGA